MRTIVYIDGFNLYYGCLKGSPYRWLDLETLCDWLLPKNRVIAVKYFTALIKPRPGENDQPIRQQTYIRALKTCPRVSIYLGHFLTHDVVLPMANPVAGIPRMVKVTKTDEKGSDVNLATHMMNDAHKNEFDCGVVVSNDSDLAEPMRIITTELKKPIGLINPQRRTSKKLLQYSSFMKKIGPSKLSRSQFPEKMKDAIGEITKPEAWK